ncbi:MAG: glycosyltransferase [Planctomycetota bacterium]|nr:glycosyltransferase [Planctomycetota bacterium]
MTASTQHRRLSVAMIVQDCAEQVAATLDSIRDIADEIVVVDTGSSDRTRDIVRPRASRLVDFIWNDSYSAARNTALQHVGGDWVLWLEAGESMTPAMAARLRAFVDGEADPQQAYLLTIQTPSTTEQLSGEQHAAIRLHPRQNNLLFEGRVRETLRRSLAESGIEVALTALNIQFAPKIPLSKDQIHHKAQRQLRLAAIELQGNGRNPATLLAMADALIALGETQKAIECYGQALQCAPRQSTSMLEGYYGLLAALDHIPTALDKQISLCATGLEIWPFDAQLLCAMGSYLQKQGRTDLACRAFEAAANHGQIDPQTTHLSDIGEVATVCRATCLEKLGQIDAAIAIIEEAIAAVSDSLRLRRNLLDLCIRHDRRQKALELADQFPQDAAQRNAMRSAVRGACLAATANWVPALAYLQTAFGSGCRDAVCMRWLCATYLETGEPQSAAQLLEKWKLQDPTNIEISRWEQVTALHLSGDAKPSCPVLPSYTGQPLTAARSTTPASIAAGSPIPTDKNFRVDDRAESLLKSTMDAAFKPHQSGKPSGR